MVGLLELLQERRIGLFDSEEGNRIRWYETTAYETGTLISGDEDYDCLGLSGFITGDVYYFRTDAPVVPVNDDEVCITNVDGKEFVFTMYEPFYAKHL